jgi:AcrR family transcriptional regulator
VAEPAATVPAPLPKGRHSLTRAQVADTQRLRLAVALTEAMAESGYVGTPVAAVLKRAGVSRQTFYELYDDKLACFLDALDLVGEVLVDRLASALGDRGDPLDRATRAVEQYLATLVEQPAYARLFLVEVHAAGPVAMQRRADLQARVVDALVGLFRVRSERGRFACQAYVAAIASLVTVPLVTGDADAIGGLRRPLVEHLRLLARSGALGR